MMDKSCKNTCHCERQRSNPKINLSWIAASYCRTPRNDRKPAFSLLEKALRSNPLTAILRSRLSRFSHTKFRNCVAHLSAFSLAEAMVMLVVISILLAVSAPLIAKKSNADQRRLVVQGQNASVATAMGNNQNFGIGTSNIPQQENNGRAKLYVTAGRRLANFVSTIAGDGPNADATEIFNVTPGANAANPNGFKVFADGTTNIQACVPDYTQKIVIASTSVNMDIYNGSSSGNFDQMYPYEVTENGYLVSTRRLCINTGVDVADQICVHPSTEIKNIKLTTNHNTGGNSDSGSCINSTDCGLGAGVSIHYFYLGAAMLPVNSSVRAKIDLPTDRTGQTFFDVNNKFFFVPCSQPNR